MTIKTINGKFILNSAGQSFNRIVYRSQIVMDEQDENTPPGHDSTWRRFILRKRREYELGSPRLTERQVAEVWHARTFEGRSFHALAREYGVTTTVLRAQLERWLKEAPLVEMYD